MGSIPGAGYFQRGRQLVLQAGLQYGPRILTPIVVVKIDGEKTASIVGQDRVDAGSNFTFQVPDDDMVGNWDI
jgi:hypothetical protein